MSAVTGACHVCGSYHGPQQTHLFGEAGRFVTEAVAEAVLEAEALRNAPPPPAPEVYVPRTMTAGRHIALQAELEAIAARRHINAPTRDEPWNDPARMQEWLRRSMRWPEHK